MSTKAYKGLNSDLEEILFTIFINYSDPSSSYASSSLKVKKFISLCQHAKLLNTKLTIPVLDLLFRSLTNKSQKMFFPTFIKSTLKLSELNDPKNFKVDSVNTYTSMITNHFLPLLNSIQSKQEEIFKYLKNFPYECLETLHLSIKGLRSVYLKVFHLELREDGDLETSSKKELEKFLKDVEMYPRLINKSKFEALWRDLVIMQGQGTEIVDGLLPEDTEDLGHFFTFSKFLIFLYLISVYAYADSKLYISSNEKLKFVLEKIEVCMNEISLANVNSILGSIEVKSQQCSAYENCDEESESFLIEGDGMELSDEEFKDIEIFYNKFCHSSDEGSDKKMKSAGFIKAIKTLCLMELRKQDRDTTLYLSKPVISPAEADLIFSKLTRRSNNTKKYSESISFPLFLTALRIIAKKIFPSIPVQHSFKLLFKDYFSQHHLSRSGSSSPLPIDDFSLHLLLSPEIQEILPALQKSFFIYFKSYTSNQNLMSYSQFLKFCKDFEIFPDLLSKNKLFQMFKIVCELLDNNESSVNTSRMSSIDKSRLSEASLTEEKFTQLLILLSLNIEVDPSLTMTLEKICFFFERLGQSPGITKILRSSNKRPQITAFLNIIDSIRHKNNLSLTQTSNKNLSFQDLAHSIILPST